ncbi:MAG: efflux RND transporter periplasmic adaptor subunit [Muribaculaceae bacterium]|nr:efflux RND transporter periplasmic adaptor subunit [Muribaculaceae bacterium]
MLPLVAASCSHKAATTDTQAPAIEVAQAVTDSVTLYKTYPGYLTSNRAIKVVARVNGQLLSKDFDAGQYVEKGKVLFRIEDNTYRDRYNQAKASLATAQSTYEYNKKHYEAIKKAFVGDAVSQMDVAQAKNSMENAEASIKSAEAALNSARINLGYCTVTAPADGWVSDGVYSVGNYVNGEAAPVEVTTIVNNSKFNVLFHIEDSQYENMIRSNGGASGPLYRAMPVHFSEELPHTYTADLYYQSPSIDPSSGTLLLKGELKNIENELKDGMYVTVSLPYGVNPRAVLINDASIGTDQLGKYVYLVNDSNRVVLQHIEVGDVYRDTLRIVNNGIEPGQRYVTKALLSVRSGMEVKPVLEK